MFGLPYHDMIAVYRSLLMFNIILYYVCSRVISLHLRSIIILGFMLRRSLCVTQLVADPPTVPDTSGTRREERVGPLSPTSDAGWRPYRTVPL